MDKNSGNLGLTDEKRQDRTRSQEMVKKLRKSWINWREEAGSNNIAGNGKKNSGNLGLTDEKRPRVRSFM